jgi:hypothetical protein
MGGGKGVRRMSTTVMREAANVKPGDRLSFLLSQGKNPIVTSAYTTTIYGRTTTVITTATEYFMLDPTDRIKLDIDIVEHGVGEADDNIMEVY